MNDTTEKKLPVAELDDSFELDDEDYYFETKEPLTAGKIVGRCFIAFFTVLLLAIVGIYLALLTVARGPSETVRNMLVLSAKQASATKWMPPLFLDKDTIDRIYENSDKVTVDVMTAEEYSSLNRDPSSDVSQQEEYDEWAGGKDGTVLHIETGSTYKAYVLLVNDPSRIFVGTSSENYENAEIGMDIFNVVAKYDAYAGINGGEFLDKGGVGTGAKPMGLTFSQGKCVWSEALTRTFIGFDSNDRLVVSESMTLAQANNLGIRDAVSFQNGNVLIDSVDGNVSLHYEGSNTGTAQRTAIGQRADGTVIMIVTDGRTAASIGATHNDMIDLMVKYGAVNAAMLDGGSSAMLYVDSYFDDYSEFDFSKLDVYQQRGLVNKYQAFSSPRTIPTFFLVRREGTN